MRFFLVEVRATILVEARDESHAKQRVEDSDDTEGQRVIEEEISSVTEVDSGP